MENERTVRKNKKIHLERIKENEFYTVSFIHAEWLIEQAEKVDQLSKYIEKLENHCDDWDWIDRNKPKIVEDGK